MNIIQAMICLSEGKKIHRTSWIEKNQFIQRFENNVYICLWDPWHKKMVLPKRNVDELLFFDKNATNWEIWEEPKIARYCYLVHYYKDSFNTKHEEKSLAYYYYNPDAECWGYGFNIKDGGGFLPEWDLTKNTKIVEVEIKEK